VCIEVVCYCCQRGTKAPQAAGRIHTDFEKGFIMAEVMKFDDFKAEGSEAAVKVLTGHFHLPNPSHQFNFSPSNLCTVP